MLFIEEISLNLVRVKVMSLNTALNECIEVHG